MWYATGRCLIRRRRISPEGFMCLPALETAKPRPITVPARLRHCPLPPRLCSPSYQSAIATNSLTKHHHGFPAGSQQVQRQRPGQMRTTDGVQCTLFWYTPGTRAQCARSKAAGWERLASGNCRESRSHSEARLDHGRHAVLRRWVRLQATAVHRLKTRPHSTGVCTGKVYVVTGSSDGLGFVCAKDIAAKGGHVIVAARNLQKCEKAAEDIKVIWCMQAALYQLALSL